MKRVGSQSGAAMLMTMSLALAFSGAPHNDAPANANAAIDAFTSLIIDSSTYLFGFATKSNATLGSN
jgi:hypothetical protein